MNTKTRIYFIVALLLLVLAIFLLSYFGTANAGTGKALGCPVPPGTENKAKCPPGCEPDKKVTTAGRNLGNSSPACPMDAKKVS
ncbi:MAG: hypothetical protein ACYCOU_02400 [Sulfobacillus sp.]